MPLAEARAMMLPSQLPLLDALEARLKSQAELELPDDDVANAAQHARGRRRGGSEARRARARLKPVNSFRPSRWPNKAPAPHAPSRLPGLRRSRNRARNAADDGLAVAARGDASHQDLPSATKSGSRRDRAFVGDLDDGGVVPAFGQPHGASGSPSAAHQLGLVDLGQLRRRAGRARARSSRRLTISTPDWSRSAPRNRSSAHAGGERRVAAQLDFAVGVNQRRSKSASRRRSGR